MEHRLEPRNYRHRHSTATLTWAQSGGAPLRVLAIAVPKVNTAKPKISDPAFFTRTLPQVYDERDPNVIATSRHQRSFLGCNARARLRNVDCTLFIRRDHKAANSSAVIECQVEGGENSRSKMPRDALACSRNGEDCRQSRMPRERGALVHKLLGVIRNVHKFWQVSAKMAISVQHKTNNTVRSSGR